MGYTKVPDGTSANGRVREIRKYLWAILFLNVGVALAKYLYGVFSHSAAMQADGIHSMFDGSSNVIGLVGMTLAARPADGTHPYGHFKYETYASGFIGVMLLFAAYNVSSTAVANLISGDFGARVDAGSFAVMVLTLAVNIVVTTWERKAGKRLGSAILTADASHTFSDVLVSLAVIVGLIFVKMGFPMADSITALVVSVAILWTASGVFRQANATLSDSARIAIDRIRDTCLSVGGVLGCHDIRTRGSEAEVYVDLHIQVDGDDTVRRGHEIAETVERTLGETFPEVVDAIVHLEPYDAYQRHKTEVEFEKLGEDVSNGGVVS